MNGRSGEESLGILLAIGPLSRRPSRPTRLLVHRLDFRGDVYTAIAMTCAGSKPEIAPAEKALARHPRPAGGDPMRRIDRPLLSLTDQVLNNAPGTTHHLAAKRKPPWLRAPGSVRSGSVPDACSGNGAK